MPDKTLPLPVTPLSEAQQSSLVQIVRRAANTEILPRFRNLTEGQISAKTGPQDLVTEADTAAEAMIARAIMQRFPNATVIGEESCAANPALRAKAAEAELAFIIDPVDGTWNFAHGVPLFGVIVAATRFGRPVYGLLYDPLTDDWITASENAPALQSEIAAPPKRLSTSTGGAFDTLFGIVHLSLMPKPQQQALAPVLTAFNRIGGLRCCCHEYRLMAQGAADFTLSGVLNPWDHAAGAYITQRAGGVARFLDGADYDTTRTEGYLLTAADEDMWTALRDTLAPALEG
ncbi:inositol monophosphatase [Aquicoccus sp. G2-2]|uniref:inositol monophosphatase family protein n=1 Tax=Aquicoccus sp. G2-2 TaxID=3092120 RepID=UPI002AE0AC57|nr:inositol monophosphatase [Aquicoccus sp. G2-2]MEA1112675.1 inositol monophosphatase [Aquicoccus sp. G2-2]